MNLRIIKKGSAKTPVVYPFFFTEEHEEKLPLPYILPESAVPGGFDSPPEESAEAVDAEPPAPAIDVEQLEKDAFDRGFSEGREDGLKEGLAAGEEAAAAKIDEMTGRYTEALEQVAALKDTLRAQVEEEVVRLALAIAKKIVHREIHVDKTIIHTLVRVALERVAGKAMVTVRLSPADYEYMMGKREDLARAEGREIIFESDNALTRGSCVIQTETGDIDARIEEEFQEVQDAFFEGL